MYIWDFLKNMIKRKNIPAIVYLLLNLIIIVFFTHMLISGFYEDSDMLPGWIKSTFWGILFYCLSAGAALSPVGEWFFRHYKNYREITRKDMKERIFPLFEEVYRRAKEKDPSIAEGIRLYLDNSDDVNAHALGRRTISVTRGLFSQNDEVIKGVLAHEFGHLSNKDTDIMLFISTGNFLITAVLMIIRVVINIISIFTSFIGILFDGDDGMFLLQAVLTFLINAVETAVMWIWTKLGVLLLMKSSREHEYEADAFAKDIGYGTGLLMFLEGRTENTKEGLFAALARSHPFLDDRIARIM